MDFLQTQKCNRKDKNQQNACKLPAIKNPNKENVFYLYNAGYKYEQHDYCPALLKLNFIVTHHHLITTDLTSSH